MIPSRALVKTSLSAFGQLTTSQGYKPSSRLKIQHYVLTFLFIILNLRHPAKLCVSSHRPLGFITIY